MKDTTRDIKKLLVKHEIWQEDCPAVLQTAILLGHAYIKQNQHLGNALQSYVTVFMKNDYGWELTSVDDKKKIFLLLTEKGISFIHNCINEWKLSLQEYEAFQNKIKGKEDLQTLSNQALGDLYHEFFQKASDAFSYPLLGESCDYFGTHDLIPLIKKKLNVSEKEAREIAVIKSKSNQMSFLDNEKRSMLRISLIDETKNRKEFQNALHKHLENFYWMKINYHDNKLLNLGDSLKELHELRKLPEKERKEKIRKLDNYQEDVLIEKEKIKGKFTFDDELIFYFKLFELISWWIDERKPMMLKMFNVLFKLLGEVQRRFEYEDNHVRYLLPEEIIESLKNNKRVDEELLRTRKKLSVYFIDDQFQQKIYVNKDAEGIQNVYWNKFKTTELNGIVASAGKGSVKAKVCVVMDVAKDQMKQGAVLVTSMTRPEFVPLMRKASAIITDEGGITCHAAIVSRELGIPCLIGTKHATKQLKTGDTVEVNVDTGEIKVIK